MNYLVKKIIIAAIIIGIGIGIIIINKYIRFVTGNMIMNSLIEMRGSLYGDVPKDKRLLVAFGEKIEHEIDYGTKEGDSTVEDYLEAGCNSNYCLNLSEGWQFNNPLMLFNTAALYLTYDKEFPEYPDVKVFNVLVKNNADVNKYPYVWAAVFCHDNYSIENSKKRFDRGELTQEKMEKRINGWISDSNRVLKLFLDAGSDVNKKGNPIPFDDDKCKYITEEEIKQYFNSPEATTPIYEAIKKGSLWESQVDLLLEYGAKLDDSCLEAAKLSGDEAMISKIEKLLNESKKK